MASERMTADELAALTWKASAFGGPHVHVRVESVDCLTCALLAEIDALRDERDKHATISDERHDAISARNRTIDGLRGEILRLRAALESKG